MTRRILPLAALLLAAFVAQAGEGTFRVRFAVYPGEDAAAVAADLASLYGGRVASAPDGNEALIELSAGTGELLARDPRVEALQAVESNATAWTTGNYSYDGSGNIKQIGEDDFEYDGDSRLVRGEAGSGNSQAITYDGFGNILTLTSTTATQGTTVSRLAVDRDTNQIDSTAAASPPNNVIGSYDDAGNMQSYNGTNFLSYDALNVVTQSTTADGGQRIYIYTAGDERIATFIMVNGQVSRSEWAFRDAGGRVLRRYTRTAPGTWQWSEDYIYRGEQVLAAEVAGPEKTRHFHLDHLGTPRLITGNGGVVIERHSYLPFGQEVAPVANSEVLKFTGQERDARSLDYMLTRYYDPLLGRFSSVDPGQDWDPLRPQKWNLYVYVGNRPLNATDPTGMTEREGRYYGRTPADSGEGWAALFGGRLDIIDRLIEQYSGRWYAIVFQDGFGMTHEAIVKLDRKNRVVEVWEHSIGWDAPREETLWEESYAGEMRWTPMLAKDLGRFFRPIKGLTSPIDHFFEEEMLQCTTYSQLQQTGSSFHVNMIRIFGTLPYQAPDLSDRKQGIFSVGYKPWKGPWTP